MHVWGIIMEEKRKNKRLELKSEICLNRLDGNGGKENTPIRVRDLSKTGIGFYCDVPLGIGDIYETVLTIWTKETIHAFVEIVRIVKEEEGVFNYGGIFIGMPETDINRIAIYATVDENLDK